METILQQRGYQIIRQMQHKGSAKICVVTSKRNFNVQISPKYICKYGTDTRRLHGEAYYMKQINHPLYPQWHEDWQENGQTFLVMEYISGTTLEELLKRRGSIFLWNAIRITLQLADGLAYLHENRPPLIYRDLKPSNIIIQDTGAVRLIDLGTLAANPTDRAGTPGYAAPEIFQNSTLQAAASYPHLHMPPDFSLPYPPQQTPACDIYSIGVLLHTMLTGKNPTRPPYCLPALKNYGLNQLEGLDQIIQNCTRPAPQTRTPNMRELIRQLTTLRPRPSFPLFSQPQTYHYQKSICLTTYNPFFIN
jgi:serine/threonine-protein kinase